MREDWGEGLVLGGDGAMENLIYHTAIFLREHIHSHLWTGPPFVQGLRTCWVPQPLKRDLSHQQNIRRIFCARPAVIWWDVQQKNKAAQGVLRKRCRLEATYSSRCVFCISGRTARGLPALFADVQQKFI